jgi:hypothetical protein
MNDAFLWHIWGLSDHSLPRWQRILAQMLFSVLKGFIRSVRILRVLHLTSLQHAFVPSPEVHCPAHCNHRSRDGAWWRMSYGQRARAGCDRSHFAQAVLCCRSSL